MNTNRSGWFIGILISALIAASFAPLRSSPIAAQALSQGGFRVIVEASQLQSSPSLQENGGQILADYGEFQLIELPPGAPIPDGARPVEDVIHLRGFDLDTRQPDNAALAPQLQQNTAPVGEGFWMVQFAGPIRDEWLRGLRAQGLEIVAYMPENAYVVWGDQPDQRTQQAMVDNPLLIWQGAYQPAFRLDTRLRALAVDPTAEPSSDVTIQIYRTKHTADTIDRLTTMAEEILTSATTMRQFTFMSIRLPTAALSEVAAMADIFNIGTFSRPVLLDEAQGQIVAGNLTNSGAFKIPTGPNYLAWLASKGFPTTPNSYPIVDVMDDGIDQGEANNVLHPDFFVQGATSNPDRIVYLNNCTGDTKADGLAGHGNLNAGIMAGYNNLSGSAYEDILGYNYGLGISPYGRIGGTKVFANSGGWDISKCPGGDATAVKNAFNAGARITSNSWGSESFGDYTAESWIYDDLTRDADNNFGNGNQQMFHIFSAGNSGESGNYTITSPGTAKNVITVGASENVRSQGIFDGCGINYANNADDVATFSSRGPTVDFRIKPDILAPGTHIQGPASQVDGYTGTGVCNIIYPENQTLYTWSSGTSHSTPAVAGVAQLTYEYYGRVLKPGSTPSPAMLKALILNSGRYLTGNLANDDFPSLHQGWGDVDLSQIFDGTPRQLIDQTVVLSSTGGSQSYQWQVADPSKPVRVSLVWTDPPGTLSSGAYYINDLNLSVTSLNQTFRGNSFSGRYSITGGPFDPVNNVENVFLPAGQAGIMTIDITAANLAGDGVPGIGDSTDQDFALVVYNAIPFTTLTQSVEVAEVSWNDSLGNNNGYIDPGERLKVTINLHNNGRAAITGVSSSLSAIGSSTVPQPTSTYPNLPAGETRTNLTEFIVDVDPNFPCGSSLDLLLSLTSNSGSGGLVITDLLVGALSTSSATTVPVNIPDYDPNNPVGADVLIQVSGGPLIDDINIRVDVEHTWDEDLIFTLKSPLNNIITLIDRRGGSGQNFSDTILDDEAAFSIAFGTPPFTGRFTPEELLSSLDQTNSSGSWHLYVDDVGIGDTGTVNSVDLIISSCAEIGVSVLPDRSNRMGMKGTSVTHTLTVKNIGPTSASFDVSISGQSWTTTPSTFTINSLLSGASTQLMVTVQIPASPIDDSDQAAVIITSHTNPLSRQAAILTTGFFTHTLFLPLVKR